MHTFLLWLQWPGMIFGMAGGPLVGSKRKPIRLIGWSIWLASDMFLVLYAHEIHSWGVLWLNAFFILTALWGIWNARPTCAGRSDE